MNGYIYRSPPPACQCTGGVPPPSPARSGGEDRPPLGSAAGPVLFPSQKIIVWKFVYVETLFITWRTSWELWNSIGIVLCVMLTIRFPLHAFLPVWYVERVIPTESWVHSVAFTRSCDTVVLSASLSSSSATSSPVRLALRKSKLTLFLGCHLCLFVWVPWLLRVVF